MRLFISYILLLVIGISGRGYSQTDTASKMIHPFVKNKLKFNNTKLELVYENALITQYGNYGSNRSYWTAFPFVLINNAKPVPVDMKGNILRLYFSKCPSADGELDLMNQQMRRAKLSMWTGMLGGTAIAASGMVASVKSGPSVLFTRFAIGSAVALAGAYLTHRFAKKADEHLRLSVDKYTSQYYRPASPDTAKPGNLARKEVDPPLKPSPRKYYQDTIMSGLERNDPGNSGLFGVAVMPVIGLKAALNNSLSGGLGLFYTYKSRFGVSAAYQMSYLDDIGGNARYSPPGGDADSYGIPVSSRRSTMLDIQTKVTVLSWEKEGYYHLWLGNTRINGQAAEVVGKIKGTILRAITARLGYQLDNRLMESGTGDGIKFVNSTPAYDYHFGEEVYNLTPNNFGSSSAMLKSNVIVIGIGYSTFRDMKINLLDETYTGKREDKRQTDLFVDVLYAHSASLEDMTYYHAIQPLTGEYFHMPQRLNISGTPINKMGIRAGYQVISMGRPHYGTKFIIEGGIRPSPATYTANEGIYAQATFGFLFGGRTRSN